VRSPVLNAAAAVISGGFLFGCASLGTTIYPNVPSLTPGIFLEGEERALLPEGVPIRPVYETGLQVTKAAEGFRSRLYNDAVRYCTIGYGHLIKKAPCDGSEPEDFRRGLTEPRGSEILKTDMERAQRAVLVMASANLTDGQYAALCDFAFNVGGGNLRASTLLAVVNRRELDLVPGQFRRWVMADGKELPGLKARREREIELFFDGLRRSRALEEEPQPPIDVRKGE
jgi:lysozyme